VGKDAKGSWAMFATTNCNIIIFPSFQSQKKIRVIFNSPFDNACFAEKDGCWVGDCILSLLWLWVVWLEEICIYHRCWHNLPGGCFDEEYEAD
jgi:hypothetical protein